MVYYLQFSGFFVIFEGICCVKIEVVFFELFLNVLCGIVIELELGDDCIIVQFVGVGFFGLLFFCVFGQFDVVWYIFIVLGIGLVVFDLESDFVVMLSFFSGSCINFEEIFCVMAFDVCIYINCFSGFIFGQQYFLCFGVNSSFIGWVGVGMACFWVD